MKKHYLILAVVIAILCVPALGEVNLPLQKDKPVLISRPSPVLDGIEQLYVSIVSPNTEPNKDGLVFKRLEVEVKNRLKKAGIKIPRRTQAYNFDIPKLRVNIDLLRLKGSQQYVFRIQIFLSRPVYLTTRERQLNIKADVWNRDPIMQVVPTKDMPAKVTDVVLEQVEAFIADWLIVNPKDKPSADANDITTVPKKQVRPAVKPAAAKYNYIASKNRKVFHKAACSSAKRILPKNLLSYNSKSEAIRAGKRPCRICKP